MSNYIFDTYSLPYKTMANLHLTEEQKNAAKTLYDTTKNALTTGSPSTKTFAEKSYETIVADTSNTFFTARTYDDLEPKKQFEICSKIHVY
ncbi:MAG: hypothetical protein MJ223_00430 [Mycoplasmoidaceae bacterium]|nr:hypothetical protein [Mycoplasmoidaceae bacterium]